MSNATRQRTLRLGTAATMLAALVLYAPTLRYPFIYDDAWTILTNRGLALPLDELLRHILAVDFHGVPDGNRPSMLLSMWLDRRLSGASPLGFHVHSVLLYSAVCALAVSTAWALAGRVRTAVATGLLFAVAPLHAEVVSAVNYREDLIAAVGVLIPLVVLFRRPFPETPVWVALIASLAWFWGLGGKATAAALCPLVPLMALALGKRGGWWKTRAPTLVLLGAAGILWGNWRLAVESAHLGVPREASVGAWELLTNTARFEARAVAHALLPIGWSPEHARETDAQAVWVAIATTLVLATVALVRTRATRLPGVALVFILVTALPSSPLAGPINAQADRYLFLPCLGGALIWGHALDRLTMRLRGSHWAGVVALAALPLAAVAARARTVWSDDQALWSAAVARAPSSPRAWSGWSRVQRRAGDFTAASRAAERAVALAADFAPAHITLAYAALASGDVDRARMALERARALRGPDQPGFERAVGCARLAPAAARRCIER